MAASTSGNPTQGGFGRMAPKSPIAGRAKRSNSGSFIDHQMPRSHDAAAAAAEAARMGARDTPDLFVPSTLGEHLLETTYLGDVVKPLVRALVHARMVTAQRGQGEDEHAHFFADLERLRNELQRSAQRRRNVELERDDLARRLDRVVGAGADPAMGRDGLGGVPYPPDRHTQGPAVPRRDRYRDPSPGVSGRGEPAGSHFRPGLNQSSSGSGSFISPRLKPIRTQGDLSGVHVDGGAGGGSSGGPPVLPGRSPQDAPRDSAYPPPRGPSPRPPYSSTASYERRSLYAPRGGPPGSAQPPPPPPPAAGPHGPPAHDPSEPYTPGAYADEWYPSSGAARPNPRFQQAGAGGPPSAGPSGPSVSYLPPHPSHRVMPPFASPRAATIYHGGGGGGGGAIYDGGPLHGDMDHDMELAGEGPRKHPKLHTDSPMRPPSVSDRGLPGSQMMMPVSMDTMSAPTRKLAATKNRTCSNCAAPHDAKFRRGPNGPGTLCDRCGSRWKKYKESEAAMLNASGPDHSIDASRGVSRSQSGQASDSRSPPSPPSGGGGAVPTSGGSGGPGDRDRDSGDTATSRISNGRDGGGDGGGQTPQERQRLPHHLSSRQREELSPSPPLAAGRGAGTQERAGGAAANGDPASSSAAGTPHNGKREEARRREASSSPDQLED
ncbi:uncharacterized protein PSFLO_05162 [Pseudozyma flocculosa]|uniref:GATA-type domain-containing protein n=1 Tax=Pseudozyma flocculosa TaxID=84751 RepID=A0A5C3F8K2_9BASI|nr:uncharacterized protein PSFLO_05162 [Pseudozyma flocculosa]